MAFAGCELQGEYGWSVCQPRSVVLAVKLQCWAGQTSRDGRAVWNTSFSMVIQSMPGVNWMQCLLKPLRSAQCSSSLSAESKSVVPRDVKWWGLSHYLPSLRQSIPVHQPQAGRFLWKLKLLSCDLGNGDLEISSTYWNGPTNGQSSLFLRDSSDLKTRQTIALYVPVYNCLIILANKESEGSSVLCVSWHYG